jgi:hypothetical protein
MDEVINETKKIFKHQWFKKIYADDLVVITKKKFIYEFIRIIRI